MFRCRAQAPAPDPQPPSRPPAPYTDDAYLALQTIAPLANNADTKIGLLAAALAILAGGAVRQRTKVAALWLGDLGVREVVALGLLTVCATALVAAGLWLFRALRPRLTSGQPSRFAFPHLADADLDELVAASPAQARREAWIQAQSISVIVRAKYRHFSRALQASIVSGAAFVGWLLVVPTP